MSIQLSGRKAALVAGLLAATTATAQAQFLGVSAEVIHFDDAGGALPCNPRVIRVYAHFASPSDQLVGVSGSPGFPLCISVIGGTFFDSDHFLASSRPPVFGALGTPGYEELSYDSWFTIGNSSIDVGPAWPSGFPFEDQVIVAPGTSFDAGGQTDWAGGPGGDPCPGGAGRRDSPLTVAWTCPPSQCEPEGCGSVVPTPQTVAGNWPGNRILFLQLAVEDDGDGEFAIEMEMGLLVVTDQAQQIGVSEVFITEPASCPADVTGDGIVNTEDLSALIVGWGPCPTFGPCPDTNDDCLVNTQDLAAVIVSWGECP